MNTTRAKKFCNFMMLLLFRALKDALDFLLTGCKPSQRSRKCNVNLKFDLFKVLLMWYQIQSSLEKISRFSCKIRSRIRKNVWKFYPPNGSYRQKGTKKWKLTENQKSIGDFKSILHVENGFSMTSPFTRHGTVTFPRNIRQLSAVSFRLSPFSSTRVNRYTLTLN